MDKVIQVDLASPKATAYSYFSEIKEALANASQGLNNKYSAKINDIRIVGEQIIINLSLPDTIANNFKIGYHLRGVSLYLLKNYPEIFTPLIFQKKLLIYTVIPKQDYNPNAGLTINERLTAISSFTELLKNTDNTSLQKIKKIIKILQED